MITNHKYVSIAFACVACVCPPPLPTGHQQEGPAIQVWVCSGFLPANRDFSPAIVTCSRARLLFALEHVETIPFVLNALSIKLA